MYYKGDNEKKLTQDRNKNMTTTIMLNKIMIRTISPEHPNKSTTTITVLIEIMIKTISRQ